MSESLESNRRGHQLGYITNRCRQMHTCFDSIFIPPSTLHRLVVLSAAGPPLARPLLVSSQRQRTTHTSSLRGTLSSERSVPFTSSTDDRFEPFEDGVGGRGPKGGSETSRGVDAMSRRWGNEGTERRTGELVEGRRRRSSERE